MENKQTAVEWLIDELTRLGHNFKLYSKEINQAKAMEKKQIKNAFNEGQNNSLDYFIPNNKMSESEQYYEETYGK